MEIYKFARTDFDERTWYEILTAHHDNPHNLPETFDQVLCNGEIDDKYLTLFEDEQFIFEISHDNLVMSDELFEQLRIEHLGTSNEVDEAIIGFYSKVASKYYNIDVDVEIKGDSCGQGFVVDVFNEQGDLLDTLALWLEDYEYEPINLKIDIEENFVEITNNGHQVVYWHIDEFEEDGTAAIAMANAIKLAYTNPKELLNILNK